MPDETDRPRLGRSLAVYGWLVVVLVLAEAIRDLASGRVVVGVILLAVSPVMILLSWSRRSEKAESKD